MTHGWGSMIDGRIDPWFGPEGRFAVADSARSEPEKTFLHEVALAEFFPILARAVSEGALIARFVERESGRVSWVACSHNCLIAVAA